MVTDSVPPFGRPSEAARLLQPKEGDGCQARGLDFLLSDRRTSVAFIAATRLDHDMNFAAVASGATGQVLKKVRLPSMLKTSVTSTCQ